MNKQIKKSKFDLIFESITGETGAPFGGSDDKFSETELEEVGVTDSIDDMGDEVTIKLSKSAAKELKSVLDELDIDSDDSDEFSDDDEVTVDDEESFTEDEDEDEENPFREGVEFEEVGTPLVNQKKGNPMNPKGSNKVEGAPSNLVKKGEASFKGRKHEVGTMDDEGTPLVNQKKGNPMNPKAPNKAPADRPMKPSEDLFA